VAHDLAEAFEIAFDWDDRNRELALEAFKFAGPARQFAIVGRAREEVAFLEDLIALIVRITAEAVNFHGLC
jgi:hypothetical protein